MESPKMEKLSSFANWEFDFKSALDSLSTNVFFCDDELVLTYINKKGQETLESIGYEFKQKYGFSSDSLIGRSIDEFHQNPEHQRRMLTNSNTKFPISAEISIGPLILDLNIAKAYSSDGTPNGFIVNWEEISEKVNAEKTAARMTNMVDLSPINTMMADKDGTLIYLNENSKKTLKTLEQHLPEKVENLVGRSIDWFHKDPAHQKRMIADPKNLPHRAIIEVGNDKLDLLVSPIFDNEGEYLGPMVTWDVITSSRKMKLINELSEASDQLSHASEDLLKFSNQLSANAEETNSQAALAATAGEQVNEGFRTVTVSMEQMTASIKEISENTNQSSRKSKEAMDISEQANEMIQELGKSSLDIGEVIKVITSIAQQTNLLALNATIEAARAGEAGKGFAVVANEVKELAKQTAQATEGISKKVEKIQNDSNSAVQSIGDVRQQVTELNNISASIASAMEEQSATTNQVAEVVNQSNKDVNQITENIKQVSDAADETGRSAGEMNKAAEALADLSTTLKGLVEQVKQTD